VIIPDLYGLYMVINPSQQFQKIVVIKRLTDNYFLINCRKFESFLFARALRINRARAKGKKRAQHVQFFAMIIASYMSATLSRLRSTAAFQLQLLGLEARANPDVDTDRNGVIDIRDIVSVALDFGKTA
jgi:hypothetical protein